MSWHINDLTVATGAPLAWYATPIGYAFEAQQTQHVIYVGADLSSGGDGSDFHIHELWWDSNGWHHNALTAETGAPLLSPIGTPSAYVFAVQGTQHIDYLGSDDHIHELWWDSNGWHHNDLTAATGAPSARSDPMGYAFEAQNTQHVVYLGTDGHIHELWWDSNEWHHNDLTVAASAPPLDIPGPYGVVPGPTGYTFEAQATQHVVYAGPDSHIHELWWDSNGWHHNDLTAATGAPSGFGPVGYAFAAQGTQHVVYQGTGIDELWWDSSGWNHNDLTAATGAPYGGTLTAYVFAAQRTQHVVYRANDGRIRELWWDNNGWHYNDLTAAAAAPGSGSEVTGYAFNAQGTQHVVYVRFTDSNGRYGNHLCELYWAQDSIHPPVPVHPPASGRS